MKLNEAGWDRIVRTLAGIALLAVGFGGVVTGTVGWIVKILGILLLVTGVVGFCPLYALLKVTTKK